jgi:hypothetical protein
MKNISNKGIIKIAMSTFIGVFITACGSSTPSTGDIEDYIEYKFSSCENMLIKNIKKTNGYQDEKYYKVDFEYTVKLKNSSHLEKLKNIYDEESAAIGESKRRMNSSKELVKQTENEHHQYTAAVTNSKTKPRSPEWGVNAEQENNYRIELEQWRATAPEYRAMKEHEEFLNDAKAELKILYANYDDDMRNAKVYGKIDAVISDYYTKGCGSATEMKKYIPIKTNSLMYGGLGRMIVVMDFGFAKDDVRWFEPQEMNMAGSVYMRKTDNGWQSI